jgi:transcription initiation factor TFIIIB Brf1 subunit/transcription initiation factor TFIIB
MVDLVEILDLCITLRLNKEDLPDDEPYIQRKYICECDEKFKLIDEQNGDVICSECGLVLQERLMQIQDEFDKNENYVPIQSSKNEFFENTVMSTIMSKNKGLMTTLHIQTSTNQKETYRNKEFIEIVRLCTDLKTTCNVANQAKHYFHDLCKLKVFRGVNRKAMMACCIIRSFLTNKINRTVTEVCDVIKVQKNIFTKNIKIYEALMNVKILNERSSDEIYRHLQSLGVKDVDVFKLSNTVILKQKDMLKSKDFQGKSPKVLLAIILKDLGFDKKNICKALTVSITAF